MPRDYSCLFLIKSLRCKEAPLTGARGGCGGKHRRRARVACSGGLQWACASGLACARAPVSAAESSAAPGCGLEYATDVCFCVGGRHAFAGTYSVTHVRRGAAAVRCRVWLTR